MLSFHKPDAGSTPFYVRHETDGSELLVGQTVTVETRKGGQTEVEITGVALVHYTYAKVAKTRRREKVEPSSRPEKVEPPAREKVADHQLIPHPVDYCPILDCGIDGMGKDSDQRCPCNHKVGDMVKEKRAIE